MKKNIRQEFNELATLSRFVSSYYNHLPLFDEIDFTDYEAHIREVEGLIRSKYSWHPNPALRAAHTLSQHPNYKPSSDKEYKEFVENLKIDLAWANTVLEYEFNKFGTDKMREKIPDLEDKFEVQKLALKHGYIQILRLL